MKRFLILLSTFCTLTLAQFSTYILCEGNYGSTNASLWSVDPNFTNVSGPLHWDVMTNPLGDTGQNLKIYTDKLFIVMNNSNTIEVADLSNGFLYEASIDLPFAGPRDIEIVNNIAYVSCWYISGILCIDLADYSIIDTLTLGCLPEDLLFYNNKLYSSITMNADWSSSDMVIEFDISQTTPVPSDTFIVITGPEELIAYDNCIYVSSTYYDTSWNAYAGNSKIDLTSREVTTKDFGITYAFNRDMTVLNNRIYRVYNNGICALTDSLTMDPESQIGNIRQIYSMTSNNNLIYLGLSNYIGPDTVMVIDTNATKIAEFPVGAIPGSFAFYETSADGIQLTDSKPVRDFQLNQNYPNPFNNTTSISYSIRTAGNINLKIYNTLGQQVAQLLDQPQSPGKYTVTWNGKNSQGVSVTSGIYYSVLHNGKQQSTIKMLYLK